ncbi:hypothetical protein BH10BAC4_BH10BAC4_12270 [soil metagenome]
MLVVPQGRNLSIEMAPPEPNLLEGCGPTEWLAITIGAFEANIHSLFVALCLPSTNIMEKRIDYSQLFLRIALGLGFIFPVMDRLGILGEAGTNGNAWGNWSNFVSYTGTLMPYMNASLTNVMAALATGAELIFGVALIVGYQTRYAALGSCLLTLAFALSMFFFSNFREPFTYSVFVASAASLLLSTIPRYRWSIDGRLR